MGLAATCGWRSSQGGAAAAASVFRLRPLPAAPVAAARTWCPVLQPQPDPHPAAATLWSQREVRHHPILLPPRPRQRRGRRPGEPAQEVPRDAPQDAAAAAASTGCCHAAAASAAATAVYAQAASAPDLQPGASGGGSKDVPSSPSPGDPHPHLRRQEQPPPPSLHPAAQDALLRPRRRRRRGPLRRRRRKRRHRRRAEPRVRAAPPAPLGLPVDRAPLGGQRQHVSGAHHRGRGGVHRPRRHRGGGQGQVLQEGRQVRQDVLVQGGGQVPPAAREEEGIAHGIQRRGRRRRRWSFANGAAEVRGNGFM